MIDLAIDRWFCQGIDTPKLDGEIISSEASMIAVARFALLTFAFDIFASPSRRSGNTSRTQCAIRLAGSGCESNLARCDAEYARSRFKRLGLSTATVKY